MSIACGKTVGMAISINSDKRVLFVGDSITDCERCDDPQGIGTGYVRLIRDYWFAKHTQTAPKVINRGIGGDMITDLVPRWQSDVLAERPHILSVNIGVNDVWAGLGDPSGGVPAARFGEIYHDLLTQTRRSLPECKLVLCEPSGIWQPQPAEAPTRLKPYIDTVHAMAKEFKAECVVPLHSAFVYALHTRPEVAWTTDGVHPTSSGHMLIALTWLQETRTT
jgi:acyl-CoA thioesterase-1